MLHLLHGQRHDKISKHRVFFSYLFGQHHLFDIKLHFLVPLVVRLAADFLVGVPECEAGGLLSELNEIVELHHVRRLQTFQFLEVYHLAPQLCTCMRATARVSWAKGVGELDQQRPTRPLHLKACDEDALRYTHRWEPRSCGKQDLTPVLEAQQNLTSAACSNALCVLSPCTLWLDIGAT